MSLLPAGHAWFTAYTCGDVYQAGDPNTLCSYVGYDYPPETCTKHGGPWFCHRAEPIVVANGWPFGWQHPDATESQEALPL